MDEETKKKKELEVLNLYWEKKWNIYIITNDKRIKSLFYLISITFIFFIFLDQGKAGEDIQFIFFGIKIQQNVALISIPLVIWLLTLRYFFLSALSLNNHQIFNAYYQEWKRRVDSLYQTTFLEEISFKEDDINELPNLYEQFWIKVNRGNAIIWKPLEFIASLGLNSIYYGINFIAIIIYVYYIYNIIERNEGIGIIIYLVVLILMIITPHRYFIQKTKESRDYFTNQ